MEIEEEKKKGSVGVKVFIVLLILIILGLVGYICYDKGLIFSNNNSNQSAVDKKDSNTDKETEVTDIALDDSEFISIYNSLEDYTYSQNRESGYESFTNEELMMLAGMNLVDGDFTVTSEAAQDGGNYYTIKGATIVNHLKEIFNDEVSLEFNSLGTNKLFVPTKVSFSEGSGMKIDSYDSATDTFKVSFTGMGGTSFLGATITERKIVSAKKVGEEIIVEEKAIYVDDIASGNNSIIYQIYSTPSRIVLLDGINTTDQNAPQLTISVDSYIDRASTITHTYKLNKTTNKYYFSSSVIK